MKLESTLNQRAKESFSKSIASAIKAGIWGYFIFLTILFFTKELSSLLIRTVPVQFESIDFVLPIIGFILLSIIRFLENYSNNEL